MKTPFETENALRFMRLEHGAGLPLPAYATEGAAGLDIRAARRAIIQPGRIEAIPTGFACAVPAGLELQVRPRSGLAARYIGVANAPGTIDSDYRGEIKVLVHNMGSEPFTIEPLDRIAQLVLAPVMRRPIMLVDELDETKRGAGGFGSTGVQ